MNSRSLLFLVALCLVPNFAAATPTAWSVIPSGTLSNLYGVASSSPGVWTAVGDGGAILRSVDGGLTWAGVSSPVADQLRAIAFRGNVGLAVGIAGRILRTADGGATWTRGPRPTTKALYSVSLGGNSCVITGEEGTVLISTDDGASWSPKGAGTASILFGVSTNGSTAVGVGGQGAIVMSDNSGAGWGLTVLGGGGLLFFYGTSFATPTTGWAVGSYAPTGSIILKSTTSGFTWTLQTAPTTSTLTGVSFVSADSGWAVGFDGTILHTTNGGTDWLTQVSNTTRSLNATAFVDPQTGIAVGDSGTIVRTVTGGAAGVEPPGGAGSALELRLDGASPNPFTSRGTSIQYQTREPGLVTLAIYDTRGARVATLVHGVLPAGPHHADWAPRGLPSGVYFCRLEVSGIALGAPSATRTVTLVR